MGASKLECTAITCDMFGCTGVHVIQPGAKSPSSEIAPTPVLIARAGGWRVFQTKNDRDSMHADVYLCPQHAKWPPEGTR